LAALDFVVDRDDLHATRLVPAEVPDASALDAGEVLLEIEKFGFSANNITYASLGETMRYWEFFPRADGWGRVPVWGYALVAASAREGIAQGERVFGYLPMSTHAVLEADRVGPAGFVDAAAHRADLPAVYQRYARLAGGEGAGAGGEDQQALWRPLFMTSFGAADFLAEQRLYEAERIVVSSASSKTALGIAFLLAGRVGDVELIALTSRSNVAFCERVGYYGSVLPYDAVERIPRDGPIAFVDLAGNDRLLREVRRHAGELLRRTVVVGATHREERAQGAPLGGGDADFFFLPPWMERRRREWGPGEFARRYDEAWSAFLPTVERWMRVEHHRGPAAVESVYRHVLDGDVDPAVGYMLSLRE
jgi:hypothetical protein